MNSTWFRLRRGFVWFVALVVALVTAATGSYLWYERGRALVDAKETELTVARILSTQVFHLVRSNEIVLNHLVEDIRDHGVEGVQDRIHHVQPLLDRMEETISAQIYGNSGKLVASTGGHGALSADISGRNYFKVLQSGAQLVIGDPITDRASGQELTIISQGLSDRNGNLIAVGQVAIAARAFDRLFDTVRSEFIDTIALFRNDGLVVARRPAIARGKRFPKAELFDRLTEAPEGVWEPVSKIDRLQRISAYSKVRDYPLSIIVSQSRANVLASWKSQSIRIGGVVGIIIAVVLGLALLAYRAIRREEQAASRLSAVFGSAPIGICGLDSDQIVLFANRAACNTSGYSDTELHGADLHEILQHSTAEGKAIPRNACKIGIAIEKGIQSFVVDEAFRRKDGSIFPVEYVVGPLGLPNGRQGAVLIFRDITNQLQIERELRETNYELNQFVQAAAHDLRTPLRGIKHLSEWLEEDFGQDLKEDVRNNFELLRNRVDRLERLLEGLRVYSTIDKLRSQPKTITVAELVEHIANQVQVPDSFVVAATGHQSELTIDLPPLLLTMTHLVENAIKHHHRSAGRIEVGVRDLGIMYEVSVTDDGPGIPATYRDKIFQMFQTLKTKDELEGGGVGLAIARKIVERFGGTISIEDGFQGKGTTVRFTWGKGRG